MSCFLSRAGVLLVAALAVAGARVSPTPKDRKAEVKSKAQPPAPVLSPHGMPMRTRAEGDINHDHSLKLLLDRVSVLQKEIYELIRETESSDPPTSNKLQELAYSVDKDLWQFRAHVERPSSRRGDVPWVRYQGHDPSVQ
jgi:hypothetical protein